MKAAVIVALVCVLGASAEPEAQHYKPAYKPESHEPHYPKPYGEHAYPAHPEKYPAAYPEKYPTAYPAAYPEKYPAAYPPKYPAAYPAYKYCDPKAAPKCAENTTNTVCLTDEEYPTYEIKYAIDYDPLVLKKYADVADQSADDLVDGISKAQEEAFDYSFYNGKQFDQGNWVGGEGFICPSDVAYSRPLRAQNVEGEWRVIVQDVAYYTQTQRVETCLFPEAACRTLAPCFHSKCVQKYVYHRMLSMDPCDTYKGLFIDTYKLPSACSCHIPVKA